MQQIYYELSVLAKAVHFKNLSAAAVHVGLSQPQLSRIIAKIESELNVVILDRSAKRKSSWTSVAFELAQIYENMLKRLEIELQSMTENQIVSELRIGTLEGLSDFARQLAHIAFEKIQLKKIILDIYDLSELEANFLSGNLDLILTSKWPGRQKFRHVLELGHQQLERVQTDSKYAVMSTFEHGRMSPKEVSSYPHVLVSNSLAIRRHWFDQHGGVGSLPSTLRKGNVKGAESVLLLGSEILNPKLWSLLSHEIEESGIL